MDYVYYPMIGRSDKLWYWNLCMIITFLLSGLWHGANWTFVVWGLYQGIFIVISMNLGKKRKKFEKKHGLKNNRAYEFLCMFVTFFIVCIGLILFRAESIGQAWEYVCGMFDVSLFKTPYLMTKTYYLPVVLSIVIMLVVEWLQRGKEHPLNLTCISSKTIRFVIYILIIFSLFLYCGQAETFIYFQF